MLSTMHLYPINGAAHASATDDTAWSYRDAHLGQVIVGVDPGSRQSEEDHQVGDELLG